MELYELGVKAAREALARGEVSSREIVESIIGRCRAKNGEIGAYVSFDEEGALALADANPKSVPVAVKDLISVAGQECTCGSKILKGYVAPEDATLVANMKRNGFMPAGRTNMDEFAMGSSTENSALCKTRNPFDPERVPGGSSGGSAAATGGNMCIAALGSDTGGSIRQPASFCNCVGVKPSYGRVSRSGVVAFASSLDQVGPMAKDVTDAAILFDAICGRDPKDGTMPELAAPNCEAALEGASLKGVRIGLPKEYYGTQGMEAETKRITDEAIAKCAAAGAELVEVSLPHTEWGMPVYYIIAMAEASANLARFDGVRFGLRSASARDVRSLYEKTRAEGLGPEVKRRIIIGTFVLSGVQNGAFFGQAQKVRRLIKRDFDEVFGKVDALLTPTVQAPAFKFGERQDPIAMYLNDLFAVPASLAGVCAASVPAGFTRAGGLPVGVQFICNAFEEARLFRVCKAFEDLAK